MNPFRGQGPRPRRRRAGAPSVRPHVDALEGRTLLSSFQLVKDVIPGPTGSGPYCLRSVGDSLLFTARTGPGVYALFQSDGTPAGTTSIKDSGLISPLRYPSYYSGVVGSRYFFVANDSTHGSELWGTDGTSSGTSFINDTEPGTESGGGQLITGDPARGVVYYVADDGNLPRSQVWRSDGTAAGTYKVTNIGDPDPPSGFGVLYGAGDGLTVASTGIYFLGTDSNYGVELYVSDGTPGNFRLVKDINPNAKARGATMNGYLPWPELDGRLYFAANDAVSGWELWSTDGTEGGTRRETDINPAGDTDDTSGAPSALVAYKGAIYFTAIDADHGRELWKFVPGTGASLVKDINPGTGSSMTVGEPYGTKLTEHDGLLFFPANDGTNGDQLWRTDGTEAGTYMVKRINTPANAFVPLRGLISLGNTLYFAANEQGTGFELWQSDGTGDGTHIVEDFWPGTPSGIALDSYTEWITAVNGTLYFTANNAGTGTEVYRLVSETGTFQFTDLAISTTVGSTFTGDVAGFTYSVASTAQDFLATIDWGDNTPIGSGSVTPDGSGGYLVSGRHAYAMSGSFTVTVNVTGPASSAGSTTTTAAVAPAPPVEFTGRVAPASDTGTSSSDGITSDATPEFVGTGQPGGRVRLYADQALIGETTIDSTGSWSLTVTQALADGTYALSASVSQPAIRALAALGTESSVAASLPGNLPLGTLVIDTIGPVVTGVMLRPARALVYLTLQDERSGFSAATLANLANYSVKRYLAPRLRDRSVEHVTGVTATVGSGATEPAAVVLNLDHNRRITHARFLVLARSGGITDRAGNALRGAFTGRFPTGSNNVPQDFKARLSFDGHRVPPVRPLATTAALPRPSRVRVVR